MFFSSLMTHFLIITTWLAPVNLTEAGTGQGATAIGGRTFRNYLEWRKTNPPTYDHLKLNKGVYSSDGDGDGISNVANPRVHETYERIAGVAQLAYHRSFDFLAFSRDINRENRRKRRERFLNAATEYLIGLGAPGKEPSVLLAHEPVPVAVSVPVVTVTGFHYMAPPPAYISSSYGHGSPSGGYLSSLYGGTSHGGYSPQALPGATGHVYVGSGSSTRHRRNSRQSGDVGTTIDCSKRNNQYAYSAQDMIGFSNEIEENAEALGATTTAKSTAGAGVETRRAKLKKGKKSSVTTSNV